MLPYPPPDVERNPVLQAEYEAVAKQIRALCQQIALLDRVHSIKVAAFHGLSPAAALRRVQSLPQSIHTGN